VHLLAILLLASIGWGATAEFTHHHGLQSTARFSQSLLQTRATEAPDQATGPRIESGETESSSSKSKTGAECLICQLHQNLSTTLFNSPPKIAAAEVRALSTPARTIFQLSEFAPNQHGRAPPVNL